MKSAALLRTVSIIVAAAALGLLIGYRVKASSEKNLGGKRGSAASGLCSPSTKPMVINIFHDGISAVTSGAGDDHVQTSVCVGDQIQWHVADSVVSGYHVFFDESPCETSTAFPPKLYEPAGSPTADFTCNVYQNAPSGKGGMRIHKYELIIDSNLDPKKTIHRYLDPHVIVAGTGLLD